MRVANHWGESRIGRAFICAGGILIASLLVAGWLESGIADLISLLGAIAGLSLAVLTTILAIRGFPNARNLDSE